MTHVATASELDDLVKLLIEDGRRVIGPVIRDGVITHDDITTIDDLPLGWTEEQEAGRYRLVETGTAQLFGFSAPSTSWKSYVYPERTLLIRAKRDGDTITVEQPEAAVQPTAFFGVRSCDLAALGVLDRVFADPAATDPNYAMLRSDVFIVAAACSTPGRTCFCASMDTGPTPTSGFDLSIRELHGPEGHQFLVEAGSDKGEEMLRRLELDAAEPRHQGLAATQHAGAVAAMTRSIDPADPLAAAAQPDHPVWDDIASRCLSCGNCTMVCPTCFCSTTEDTTNLTATTGERWRVWDTCFSLDHSSLHGGAVRDTTASRYRQWLVHKLVTWHDQFATSGCVGCGRCISWCPVGIDLTVEIARLARPQEAST